MATSAYTFAFVCIPSFLFDEKTVNAFSTLIAKAY